MNTLVPLRHARRHRQSQGGLSRFRHTLEDADPDIRILIAAKAEYAKHEEPALDLGDKSPLSSLVQQAAGERNRKADQLGSLCRGEPSASRIVGSHQGFGRGLSWTRWRSLQSRGRYSERQPRQLEYISNSLRG
jgi:hypothetical protein